MIIYEEMTSGDKMPYYKDDFTDFVMQHPKSNPRYAGLARKMLSHYLGDLYNPETFDYNMEFMIRNCIQIVLELKVIDKEPYDWPLIDNMFRKMLYDEGFKHLTYDKEIIERGYNGVMRGDLPKHYA